MAKRFTKVAAVIWRSSRFDSLPTNESKLLMFYYLTSEHQNSAGCHSIPDGYAIADLGWTYAEYHQARADLVTAGLVSFDQDTSTVYINGWFRHCPAMNNKHAIAVRRMLDELEPSDVQEMASAEFEQAEATRNPVEDNVHPFGGARPFNAAGFRRTF